MKKKLRPISWLKDRICYDPMATSHKRTRVFVLTLTLIGFLSGRFDEFHRKSHSAKSVKRAVKRLKIYFFPLSFRCCNRFTLKRVLCAKHVRFDFVCMCVCACVSPQRLPRLSWILRVFRITYHNNEKTNFDEKELFYCNAFGTNYLAQLQ